MAEELLIDTTRVARMARAIGGHVPECKTSKFADSLSNVAFVVECEPREVMKRLIENNQEETPVTSLPDGVGRIRNYAFYYHTNLALTSLPEGITSIGDEAFRGCTSLTTLTFKGTPTTISSTAFDNCSNLTTINVPWAEGEVANAPWGATNATINYGYAGDTAE